MFNEVKSNIAIDKLDEIQILIDNLEDYLKSFIILTPTNRHNFSSLDIEIMGKEIDKMYFEIIESLIEFQYLALEAGLDEDVIIKYDNLVKDYRLRHRMTLNEVNIRFCDLSLTEAYSSKNSNDVKKFIKKALNYRYERLEILEILGNKESIIREKEVIKTCEDTCKRLGA